MTVRQVLIDTNLISKAFLISLDISNIVCLTLGALMKDSSFVIFDEQNAQLVVLLMSIIKKY